MNNYKITYKNMYSSAAGFLSIILKAKSKANASGILMLSLNDTAYYIQSIRLIKE